MERFKGYGTCKVIYVLYGVINTRSWEWTKNGVWYVFLNDKSATFLHSLLESQFSLWWQTMTSDWGGSQNMVACTSPFCWNSLWQLPLPSGNQLVQRLIMVATQWGSKASLEFGVDPLVPSEPADGFSPGLTSWPYVLRDPKSEPQMTCSQFPA